MNVEPAKARETEAFLHEVRWKLGVSTRTHACSSADTQPLRLPKTEQCCKQSPARLTHPDGIEPQVGVVETLVHWCVLLTAVRSCASFEGGQRHLFLFLEHQVCTVPHLVLSSCTHACACAREYSLLLRSA